MSINVGAHTTPSGMWYVDWKAMQKDKAEDGEIGLCFKTAIENWELQMLTGGTALTEEEKEQIREIIAQWLDENPLKTDEDKAKFTAFVKLLYEKFGARHDLMYFIGETTISLWLEENPVETERDKIAFVNFIRLVEGALHDAKAALSDIVNRPFINFGGVEADPVPSRLFPLQFALNE